MNTQGVTHMSTKPTVRVTGASTGIGALYAYRLVRARAPRWIEHCINVAGHHQQDPAQAFNRSPANRGTKLPQIPDWRALANADFGLDGTGKGPKQVTEINGADASAGSLLESRRLRMNAAKAQG
jgi:hypothetical protein